MSIIDDLKNNEKPFGLMSEEMQKKARKVGKDDFEVVHGRGSDGKVSWCIASIENNRALILGAFDPEHTYRLRPDYEEEGGVVKCEVIRDEKDHEHHLRFHYNQGSFFLEQAGSFGNFIGYLYEDGVISSLPRMYGIDDIGDRNFYVYEKDLDRTRLLTPTQVLFRSKQ